MKKTSLFAKIVLLVFIVTLVSAAAAGCSQTPVIGISQFGEHASLDNCRLGFMQGLKDAGLTEGQDFTIDYQNAGFDGAIATQIAQTFQPKTWP